MEDIRTLPAEPVGEHLSDDEFISYSMEMLPEEEVERVDAHLASCPDCAEQMEQLLEASEAWSGEQGKQRFATLRQRVLESPKIELVGTPADILHSIPISAFEKLAAKTSKTSYMTTEEVLEERRTKGGERRVIRKEGYIIIRFASPDLKTEGQQIRVTVGDFQRESGLTKIAPDLVGAEIQITQEEWNAFPNHETLCFERID